MNKSKLFPFIIILISLIIFIFISALSYVNATFNNISDSVFRLHVIANSDSQEDQNLKLLIRDGVLEYMNSLTEHCSTKQEAINTVNSNKEIFEAIAKKIIADNGYNYDVKINIGNFYFPTKNYGDISLPAGNYDGLKIEIGKATGQNWWCVMFPPLCFVDVTSGIVPEESKTIMEDNLSSEEYVLVSDNNSLDVKLKFKIIEFFKSL